VRKNEPVVDVTQLPEGLPVPADDGACDHLLGMEFPSCWLDSSRGDDVVVDRALSVVYVFPMMGKPGVDLPEGWDATPGARGCSVQSMAYARAFEAFSALGASVYGLSSQPVSELIEASGRLGLPQELLSDASGAVRAALKLPVFELDGVEYLRRAAIGVRDGHIDHVSYPIFPPGSETPAVLAWLEASS
jgi:peroxiredoxin